METLNSKERETNGDKYSESNGTDEINSIVTNPHSSHELLLQRSERKFVLIVRPPN